MISIAAFCASHETVPDHYRDLAESLGAEIGRRGHTLVSGGGRVSMMGAMAGAARAEGGHTVGVIPEALYLREVADTAADELIVTDDMLQRKDIMLTRSDAVVALPGGLGTLDELFEVWTTRGLGLHHKPIVFLDPDGFYSGLRDWLAEVADRGFVRPETVALPAVAHTAPEAVDFIETEAPAPARRTPDTVQRVGDGST